MKNRQKELILADAELNKQDNYLCPSCVGRVHLKIEKVIRSHFAHYQNATCTVFSESETEEHIDGKLQLAR